ncbi:MAG: hypothetical protein C5B55_11840 [Blastocatellia bacterium]|nr:MAG: hypothetical protein C5B55_11840 [Blastocatellia bacterium]
MSLRILLALVLTNISLAPIRQQPTATSTLQLTLQTTSSEKNAAPELELVLKNVGTNDVVVNMGFMLANGKVQLPANIALDFIDSFGRERRFEFADKKHAGIAGRVDDYAVPLRAGSSYTLRISLDQFWCQETSEFEVNLTPGRNQITAELEGTGAKYLNLDTPGLKLMNFWLGKVRSNTLVIEK